jgi:small subunit ribosomal protein S2
VVALVDTNCDPDEADFVVPGNDDAIKSCDLVIRTIADAMEAGKQKVRPEEFAQEAAPAPQAPAAPPAEEAPPAPEAEAAPTAEEAPADEQLSQGESAEETAKAEAEEVPAE